MWKLWLNCLIGVINYQRQGVDALLEMEGISLSGTDDYVARYRLG